MTFYTVYFAQDDQAATELDQIYCHGVEQWLGEMFSAFDFAEMMHDPHERAPWGRYARLLHVAECDDCVYYVHHDTHGPCLSITVEEYAD